MLNKAGTTFRALPEEDRGNLDEARAVALMLAQPTMIKRPVVEIDGRLVAVGFKVETFAEYFPA